MHQHACKLEVKPTLAFRIAVMMAFLKPAQITHTANLAALCSHTMEVFHQRTIGIELKLLAAMLMQTRAISLYLKPVTRELSPKYVRKRSLRLIVRFVTM